MRSKSAGMWIVAAAIVVVGLLAWQAGANNAANNIPAAPTAATVNLEKVINELDQRLVLEAELKEYIDERQSRMDELRTKAQATLDELNIMVEGNDAYKSKVEDLARYRVLLEAEENFAKQQIAVRQGDIMSTLFENVSEAVTRIAEAEGYDIIFSNDYGIKIQGGDSNGVMRQIAVRRMLYVNEAIDISDQVLQLMNNEWKAGAN